MKRTFQPKSLATVILAFFAIAALTAGCGNGGNGGDNAVVGGYTRQRSITDDEREMFDRAVAEIGDIEYKPRSVATQVVAGTNYRFVCKARETAKGGKRFDAVIVIYKPLPGQGDPRITSIERSRR